MISLAGASAAEGVPEESGGLRRARGFALRLGRKAHSLRARYACGFTVSPGDVDAFVNAVETLSRDHGLVTAMGDRARSAFDTKYERKIGTARIRESLEKFREP